MEKIIEVAIEAVADKGVAIGRSGGKAVFVRLAAPGDVARVRITEEKPGWARGEIISLSTPSPHRVEPACPHFGRCGGCAWQHLAPLEELKGKASSLMGFFKSRLGLPDQAFGPPVPSPSTYGYRNRITLTVTPGRSGAALCMAGLRSHNLVEIASCPVATPAVNGALGALGGQRAFIPAPSRLLLQEDGRGRVWAVVETGRRLDGARAGKLAAVAREAGLAGVWQSDGKNTPVPLPGSEAADMSFHVRAGELEFALSTPVGAFVQANQAVSAALVDLAMERSEHFAGKKAFDFYCGSGNFTLALASLAGDVTGVEWDSRAAAAAERNARAAGLQNIRVVSAKVEKTIDKEAVRADFWLLDPPRGGAPELAALSASGPPSIFYVSCDPATMARDLAAMQKHGYLIESVRAADMFPRTSHLEVTAFLTRSF